VTSRPASGGSRTGIAVRWNAATTVIMTGTQMLQVILLAHWLSPAQFGLAAVALAIQVSLQAFCDLGLTNALVQREHIDKAGWSSAWWATLATGCALAAAMILAAWPLEAGLKLPGLKFLLIAGAVTLPLFGPASVCQAWLQRHLRFRPLAIADMAGAAAAMMSAVLWGWHFRSASALLAGQVALVTVRFSLLWVFSKFSFQGRFRGADIRPLLSGFGGYQMGERAVQFLGTTLDRALVARLLGPVATGYYAMASQLALRPAALMGPFISRTLLPLMSRLQGDRPRLVAAYLRSLSTLGFVAALIYGLLFGLAEPLVWLLLGPKWEGVVLTLRIFSLVGLLNVLGNTLDVLLLSLARARTGFWLNVAMLVLRVSGMVVGARYGLNGLAAALAIVMMLSLPVDVWLPRRWLGVAAGKTIGAGGWAIPPGILTALALTWAVTRLHWAPAVEVACLGTAGVALFAGAAWLFHRHRLAAVVQEFRTKLN